MKKEKIPLLKDKHNHVSIYSALIDCLDIQNIRSKSEAISKIMDREDEISIVLGWNSGYYDFEDRELNRLQPLILCDLSLHDIRVNQPAEKLLKDEYPKLIENLENKRWVEKNFSYVMKTLVELKSLDVQNVDSLYDDLLEKGVAYAADMLLPDEHTLNILKKSDIEENTEIWTELDTYRDLSRSGKRYVDGIKFFTDGAIGTKTAAMKNGYKDGSEGVLLYKGDELRQKLMEIIEEDKPVSIHAIGDKASEEVLDELEEIENEVYDLPYIRMEHCQFIDEKYARKAKGLDINLCMQPTFSFDSAYYRDRLSKHYLKNNNPFRMLIDDVGFEPGEDIFFGSDGMPHGAYPALKSCLFPPLKDQSLKLEEFVEAYCVDDLEKGHIEVTIDKDESEIETEVVLE